MTGLRACRGGHLWNPQKEGRLCPKCFFYGNEISDYKLKFLKVLGWKVLK